MQMMYQTIHKALVEVGLDGQYEPQDFLNFFCLGTREVADGTVSVYNSPRTPPKSNANANAIQVCVYSLRSRLIVVLEFRTCFILSVILCFFIAYIC